MFPPGYFAFFVIIMLPPSTDLFEFNYYDIGRISENHILELLNGIAKILFQEVASPSDLEVVGSEEAKLLEIPGTKKEVLAAIILCFSSSLIECL